MKLDPIIAVKDVEESAAWYQRVFGCKGMHGGDEFEVLVTPEDKIFLCLHKWGAHEHPTMKNPNTKVGNGLILYFRIKNMEMVCQNLKNLDYGFEKEIQTNPNSGKKEFSVIDPNGYYLTVSEFHKFQG